MRVTLLRRVELACRNAALLAVALATAATDAHPEEHAAKVAQAPAVSIKHTEIIVAENWTITCLTPASPKATQACSADLKIFQTDKATNAHRVVFSWVLGKEGAKPTSVVIVPTGVLIADGVNVKVGERPAKTLPFKLCQPDHCEASLSIDESLAKAFSTQSAAEFSVTGSNGAVAKFTANLKGFAEAWAAVVK